MTDTHHRDGSFRCRTVRNLSIPVWRDAPTPQHLAQLRDINIKLSTRFPDGIALLNIVLGGTPRFSEEVRRETASLIRESQSYSLGSAHVLLIGGLVGAAVRTFISTALLAARTKNPNKVFGDAATAATFLATLLNAKGSERWEPAQIEQLCNEAKLQS